MTTSLILAGLWILAAAVCGFTRGVPDGRAAGVLTAGGIMLVGYVTWENGPVWGLLMLAAGTVVLRQLPLALARRPSKRKG